MLCICSKRSCPYCSHDGGADSALSRPDFHPSLAEEMTQAIELLRKPHPADQIAEDILHQLVDKRPSVRTN